MSLSSGPRVASLHLASHTRSALAHRNIFGQSFRAGVSRIKAPLLNTFRAIRAAVISAVWPEVDTTALPKQGARRGRVL
jgi:hypothetical protein